MSELFGIPERKDTTLNKVGRFLQGFGAGYQGRGAEHLALQQERQQQLDERRQKAMAQDAMRVYSSLNDGKYDDAIELINDRVKAINELGGDASDTLEIRNLIVSGRLDEAQQELGGFLELAMQNGLIEPPKRPEPLAANQVINGQVVMPEGAGFRSVPVAGMQTEQPRSTFGLSPVYIEDAEGNVRIAQPSSAGGVQVIDLPEGMRAMMPASQRAFNPADIATRGQAQTAVEVANEQALRPEVAATAGDVVSAQEQARINLMADEAQAQRAATRITEQGARTGALQTREDQFGLLNDLANVAKDQSSAWTTGFIGSALSKVPGTPAYDLGRTLDTLQASAGFETLQQMRDNSPTGGALGSITERELALLQATWSSLQQSQSKEQFESNLGRFQRQLENSWNRVNNAYERDYGVPYFQNGQRPAASSQSAPITSNDPAGIL